VRAAGVALIRSLDAVAGVSEEGSSRHVSDDIAQVLAGQLPDLLRDWSANIVIWTSKELKSRSRP
jgi:hypothetical protein